MLPKHDEIDAETDRRKSGVYRHRSGQNTTQSTVSIGDAIKSSIEKLGLTTKFQEQRALSLWPEIVGEQVASMTKAYQIKHGDLLVSVQNATWQFHLMFERDNYRKQINDALGREVVRLIRFTK